LCQYQIVYFAYHKRVSWTRTKFRYCSSSSCS